MAVAIWVGLASLVLGILIRLHVFPPFPVNLQPRAYLKFTDTCLLFAILAGLYQMIRAKKG